MGTWWTTATLKVFLYIQWWFFPKYSLHPFQRLPIIYCAQGRGSGSRWSDSCDFLKSPDSNSDFTYGRIRFLVCSRFLDPLIFNFSFKRYMKYIYNIKNNDLSFNNFDIQISIEKNGSQIRIILGTDPDFSFSARVWSGS